MIIAKVFTKNKECLMTYDDIVENIRRLSRGQRVSDDELYKLLLDNGCYYLLSKSEEYVQHCKSHIGVNSFIVGWRYAICQEFFEKLKDIPYAHIKGGALSSRIYGSPAYRSFGDIDLLTAPEYSECVKRLLMEFGFVQGRIVNGKILPFSRQEIIFQKSFSHQIAPFVKKTESKICPIINVDINLSIVWGEGDVPINMNEFISHSKCMKITNYDICCLQPVWEFIALCMHHYKDMNSIYLIAERGFNLSEYCDIYFYIINVCPDANKIAEISKKYGISDYVFYCIYYANEIFDDPRLSEYLNKLDSESARKLICCYGLADFERKEWGVTFYERLFDRGFKEKFYATLCEEDQRKVETNRNYM